MNNAKKWIDLVWLGVLLFMVFYAIVQSCVDAKYEKEFRREKEK
jgi:hypothetical protein